MAAGLGRKGHRLESWCPPTADRTYLPLDGLMPEHVVPYAPLAPRRRDLAVPGRRGQRKHFLAMDRHVRACAEAINAGGFDVLLAANCWFFAVTGIGRHVTIPKLLYCQEPCRRHYEAEFGLTAAGARPRIFGNGSVLRAARAWAGRVLTDYWRDTAIADEREGAAAFDLILANSAYSRESLLRSYGLDSRVCYLGINAGMFQQTGPERARERFVIGLGALQPHKDAGAAIEAIATLPVEERPPLVWIGNMADTRYAERMRALAERLGVVFTPLTRVTDEVLVDYLSRAAVMLYTSRMEPFGFAPLEANACGTPVVAVAEGGVRETILPGVNGLLVPDRDPRALGRALREVLNDGALARRLGENGRQRVRSMWTWDACVDRLEQSLRDVIDARRRG